MRNGLTATLLVVAILVGAVAGYSVGTNSVHTTTITTTSTATTNGIVCDASAGVAVPADGGLPLAIYNARYQCERVLVIPPGTTGTLTVSYFANASAVTPRSAGGTPIANLTARVLVARFSEIPATPAEFTYVNATDVSVSASPSSVNVTKLGEVNLTVTYTIKVSPGIGPGNYELEYLDACPGMIPLAVAQSASKVNVSSFADYQPFNQGCSELVMLQGGNLLSVNGIQMTWIVQAVDQGNTG
jgi:hypothetical protein